MQTVKWVLINFAILVAVVVLAVLLIFWNGKRLLSRNYDFEQPRLQIPTGPEAVARGEHIVHHVAVCVECHGPNLEGKVVMDETNFAELPAPNLTSGAGGVGALMTDEKWILALRHGVGADGRGLIFMPSNNYNQMRDDDLGAVIAYLKQLPPQDNLKLPRRYASALAIFFVGLGVMPAQAATIDHEAFSSIVPVGVTPEYGAYLVTLGSCGLCHGENLAGGTDPRQPRGMNITSGGSVGRWTEQGFIDAFRKGITPGGATFSDEMPWEEYGGMTDDELKAIFAYLMSTDPLSPNQ